MVDEITGTFSTQEDNPVITSSAVRASADSTYQPKGKKCTVRETASLQPKDPGHQKIREHQLALHIHQEEESCDYNPHSYSWD